MAPGHRLTRIAPMAPFLIYGEEEVSRTIRDEPPTHFSLKIKSFSLLSNSSLERYESENFEAGGHKWRLCLYPKGDKDRNGEGYISLYLEISVTNSLSPRWEIHALFRLLVLDQLRDKYLSLQDAYGEATRFRATKTQSGFNRFITLKEFNNPTKGFLVNDTCEFGAEVFVHKESVSGKRQCLLMTPGPVKCNHKWIIDKFSELVKEYHSSQVFTAGGHKWRLDLYPKGCLEFEGKSLSLFLNLEDPKPIIPGQGVYVEAQIRVTDQISGKDLQNKLNHWFTASEIGWGWSNFVSLSSFRDQSKGYLIKDTCIIEAQFLLIGEIEKVTPKSE